MYGTILIDCLRPQLVEVAAPKNAMDDHYLLCPVFASRTLDHIGWEHAAGKLLRPVVRWLSTVPPAGKGRWWDSSTVGGKRLPTDWRRVRAIGEPYGVLVTAAGSTVLPRPERSKHTYTQSACLRVMCGGRF